MQDLCREYVRGVLHGHEELALAMLWLAAYTFLLRLPSEVCTHYHFKFVSLWRVQLEWQALPMCKGTPSELSVADKQTLIWKEGEHVCIRLLRRKNTCAVHTLWDRFFRQLPDGHQPWQQVSPGHARERLRALLGKPGMAQPQKYGTQDFRRGHAEVLTCCTDWLACRYAYTVVRGRAAVRLRASRNPQGRAVAQFGLHEVS